jgi:tetratricopeptide (TPR) repeat protein/transcriptional regulator with XRE-family HTH domain
MADGDLTFGARLVSCRQSAGLSQDGLAKRTGLSVRTISNLERGRARWPHADSVRRLADALGLRGRRRGEFFAAAARRLPDEGQAQAPGTVMPPAPRQLPDEGQVWAPGVVMPPAPRQLPAAISGFAGRAGELAALDALLAEARPGACTPALVISAIGGTAGVGKTALAVQWAHQVADRFPDGQLYVNLRGYDQDGPVPTGDALAGFLRALGVPGQQIPDVTEDRARMYRSRLAGRRMLVLLDNARDGDQVRPLLPGDPDCVAVVTSRDALAGLVVTDGARRLDLDVLPLADAVALLRSLIGARADGDPQVATLAGLCARLPLALRIAAEMATARPATPLAELVAELEADRLDCLDAGEDRAEVRAVFSWSLRQLPDETAQAFALLSLHPGQDLDGPAAAALTGATTRQAAKLLARLHRASLIHASGPGRYGMHDLLRAYAREQAATHGAGRCQQGMTRLFDYYLAAAAAAMGILLPAEGRQRPSIPPSAAAVPALAGQGDARAWLDRERANLTAVVVHCAEHGWPQHVTRLAGILHHYLMRGSHLPEGEAIHGRALHAARQCGDVAAEAHARNGLGAICYMKGHFGDAVGHYQAALALYRTGGRSGQASVLLNLGQIERQMHNYRSAVRYFRKAAAAFTDADDSSGAARALVDLAEAEAELGRYDQAARHLQRARPTARAVKDQYGEGSALEVTGILSLRRGQLAQAAGFFEQALAVFRRLEFPTQVAAQLFNLGDISLRQAEYQQAIGYLEQALTLFRQAGYHFGEIRTLFSLAEARHGAGQPAAAQAELTAALRLAAETDNTYQQANAHRDLADSHHRAGEGEQARHHWQQALTLYTRLGAPEADQLRSRSGTADRMGQTTG